KSKTHKQAQRLTQSSNCSTHQPLSKSQIKALRQSRQSITSQQAWEMIQINSGLTNQSLNQFQIKALNALKSPPVTDKGKKVRSRLDLVHATCKPNGDRAVWLCCISMTQSHLADMNKKEWSSFLAKLGKEKNGKIIDPLPTYENPTLKALERVSSSTICDMIKKVPIEGNKQSVQTASLTMIFPKWNDDICSMILDISHGVDHLARALFEASFTIAEQRRHIIISSGGALSAPNDVFILKGAKKRATEEIFGSMIYKALIDNPESGGSDDVVLESVSMTIRREDAVLKLSLDPMRAVEVAKVLYV
ncbi:hypothetical protein BDV35DRAFT_375089, partial [Aspergillus flavus]